MENHEINKKKIIKYHSYGGDNINLYTGQNSIIKSEADENKLNRSILKRSKVLNNKKVLFNFEKCEVDGGKRRSKFNQVSSMINESLLKTNITKEQTDFNDTFKKSIDNKIINSTNDINTNNQFPTENKILFKNRSQGNIFTDSKLKKYYLKNRIERKESEDENIFNLNIVSDINNVLFRKNSENSNSILPQQNMPLNNLPSQEINLEAYDNLEDTMKSRTQYPFKKMNLKENEETLPKLTRKKISQKMPFLLKSKKEKITANDIIYHYLKENERDISKNVPFNNFKKYLKDNDYKKFNYGLDKIYGNTKSFLRRVDEIKKNNVIAYKNDFNIENYQNTLLKILKKRVTEKSYNKLQRSYKLFNERNYDIIIPRGRYINLAEKLKDFLSRDIYEQMKRTDRNYLLYLMKNKALKNKKETENEIKETFYKKLNATVKSFNKKLKRNQSY